MYDSKFNDEYYIVPLILGMILHVIAIKTLDPIFVIIVYFILGFFILYLFRALNYFEINAYKITFSICTFWAGISAIYRNILKDLHQLSSDTHLFYSLSSDIYTNIPIEQMRKLVDGFGAVIVYKEAYRFFLKLDIYSGHYIGVFFNVLVVSLVAVIVVKIVSIIFPLDIDRIKKIIVLFSLCGIFWLYASQHMRDSFILLVNAILVFYWVKYLTHKTIGNMVAVLIITVILYYVFYYLRVEFQAVPFIFFISAVLAVVISRIEAPSIKLMLPIFIIFLGVLYVTSFSFSQVEDSLSYGSLVYNGGETVNKTSLAEKYIVRAPVPVRIIFGSVYLHMFPVPFWHGFQLESAYHLLKSFYALFLYLVVPYGVYGIMKVIRAEGIFKYDAILFVTFTYLSFVMIISITSLETRHLGAFSFLFLILSLVPNPQLESDFRQIRVYQKYWFSGVIGLHLLWMLIKLQ